MYQNLDLKTARINAGHTVEEVAFALKIRKHYIVALEEGEFESLPGKVYSNGYLNLYLKYLGLQDQQEASFPKEVMHSSRSSDSRYSKSQRYILLGFSCVLLVCVFYSYDLLLV